MARKPNFTAAKIKKTQQALLEILEKMPIIATACQKVGISRMTYYRWSKADEKFAEQVDKALVISRNTINDLAESKLIQGMQEGKSWAILNWLKHNSERYMPINRKNQGNSIDLGKYRDLFTQAIQKALPNLFKRKK